MSDKKLSGLNQMLSDVIKSEEDSHTSRASRLLLLIFGIAIVAFGLWASQSHIDELARARGQVLSEARTQVMQSVDGGVLQEILVHEGGRVEKGQILARLDRSRVQAGVDDSRAKVAALRASVVRLKAEVFGHTPKFGTEFAEWPQFVKNQSDLFERRQRALHEGVDALQQVLVNVRSELRMTEPLEAAGDVGRVDVLRLKRQEAEIQGQIVNMRNKYFQDAQSEMTKAMEELSTQEQALVDRQTLLDRTEVIAPMNGIVKRIHITTIGAAVKPGDTLMELVPSDGEFIVEAKFAPTDVAFLQEGLPAAVKLDAYDYAIYGQATGEVIYISPDSISEQDPVGGERVYYRVRVRITGLPEKSVRGRPAILQPGMTAQVEVKTATKTVMDYLLKPITKTLHDAMTER